MKIPQVDLQEIAERNGISLKEAKAIIASAHKGMKPAQKRFHVKEGGNDHRCTVIRQGIGILTTPYGFFWQLDFFINDRWKKYSVVVRSKMSTDFTPVFDNPSRVALRIDSGCESSQKFDDMSCDCRDQLLLAMQEIAKIGEGILINIPNQDGRGMGNPFKLATLFLQDKLRLTTVEAASVLTDGGPIDKRSYAGVIAILRFLKISQKSEIGLMTNNPHKFHVFAENGYRASERIPLIVPPTHHTRRHLEAKQLYLGHKDLVSEEEA